MATLPIGVQTRCFRQPLRRALHSACALGVDGVEIDVRNELRIADFSDTGLRQFRKLLEDLRLRVLAVAFPTRRGLDDPEEQERRVLAIREAMTFAYQIGAGVVVGRGGSLPTDDQTTLGPTLVDSLTLLAAHGEHCGARYAFTSGDPPAAQRRLLDRFDSGAIGVSLHPALLLGEASEPAEAANELGGHVLHAYAVDAVREPSISGQRATEVQLGRGEADFPAVLGALEEHAYQGPLIIQRHARDDPVADAGDAVAFLRSL